MNNYERWCSYTASLPSPDNFIKWGWLYTVSAALQRRVWCPPEHDRLYPNIYCVLTGDPGIGKGGVISAVTSILTQFKLEDFKPNSEAALSDVEKSVAQSVAESELKAAQEHEEKSTNRADIAKPLLLPNGGNAATYQALIMAMAKSYRRINYVGWDAKTQKNRMNIYGHSSMYFCLQELGSLFRKHTEDLMVFLNESYDCAEEYKYETISRGEDRIRRVCLNLLAGTIPDFLQSTFDDKLVSGGFASRAFFIFALKNRKAVFFREELTEEQKQHRAEIIEHIGKLTHLYGQVRIAPETVRFLQDWIEQDQQHPSRRASKSASLKSYYARKNIHIMKVAMAIHFGESTEMEIGIPVFQKAIEVLHEEEKTMGLALLMGGANPLAKPSKKIVEYLRDFGKRNETELLAEFWDKGLRKTELTEVLNFLNQTDQIEFKQELDEVTGQKHTFYYAKV